MNDLPMITHTLLFSYMYCSKIKPLLPEGMYFKSIDRLNMSGLMARLSSFLLMGIL